MTKEDLAEVWQSVNTRDPVQVEHLYNISNVSGLLEESMYVFPRVTYPQVTTVTVYCSNTHVYLYLARRHHGVIAANAAFI